MAAEIPYNLLRIDPAREWGSWQQYDPYSESHWTEEFDLGLENVAFHNNILRDIFIRGASALANIPQLFPQTQRNLNKYGAMIFLPEIRREFNGSNYNRVAGALEMNLYQQHGKELRYQGEVLRMVAACVENYGNLYNLRLTVAGQRMEPEVIPQVYFDEEQGTVQVGLPSEIQDSGLGCFYEEAGPLLAVFPFLVNSIGHEAAFMQMEYKHDWELREPGKSLEFRVTLDEGTNLRQHYYGHLVRHDYRPKKSGWFGF